MCSSHPAHHVHAAGCHVALVAQLVAAVVVGGSCVLPVRQLLLFIAPEQLKPFVQTA